MHTNLSPRLFFSTISPNSKFCFYSQFHPTTQEFSSSHKRSESIKKQFVDQIKNNIQWSDVAYCSQDGAPLTCLIGEPNLSFNHFPSLIFLFFFFDSQINKSRLTQIYHINV